MKLILNRSMQLRYLNYIYYTCFWHRNIIKTPFY